jgi:hypothetical protein
LGGGANSPLIDLNGLDDDDDCDGCLVDEDDVPPYGPRTKSSMSHHSHRSNNSFRSTKSYRAADQGGRTR